MKIQSYKKSGKTFYRFQIYLGIDERTGKPRRTTRQGFKTKKDAEIAYLRIKNAEEAELKPVVLEELAEQWFLVYKDTVKPSTYQKTRQLYTGHLQPLFGAQRITSITPQQVQAFVQEKARETVNYNKIKNLLSAILRFGVQRGHLQANPCQYVKSPRQQKSAIRDEDKFYTPEELSLFLDACKTYLDPFWYTFFWVISHTGMRREEILALHWKDLKNGELHISRALTIGYGNKQTILTTKTTSSNRKILLDEETRRLLAAMDRRSDVIIFPNTRGDYMALSTPIKYMQKAIKSAGLKPLTLHGLRHTHCSHLLMAGVLIKDVQRRMGHADIKTTMDVYAHVSPQSQEAALSRYISFLSANGS